MKRRRSMLAVFPLAVFPLTVTLLAGCASGVTGTPAPAPPAPAATPSIAPSAAPVPARSSQGSESRSDAVRYDWGVPDHLVTIAHDPTVPPLPLLLEVRSGDHSAEGYERVTFAFKGAFPGYHFQIVPAVRRDGSDAPVQLPGRAFLLLVFRPADAHDAGGRPSVPTALQRPGFPLLSGYQQVGDYEGSVSYGFGFAAGPPQIRVGELTRPDGSTVVAVDVRSAPAA